MLAVVVLLLLLLFGRSTPGMPRAFDLADAILSVILVFLGVWLIVRLLGIAVPW